MCRLWSNIAFMNYQNWGFNENKKTTTKNQKWNINTLFSHFLLLECKNVLKKGRWGSIYTRSASNVHGFEVAGFDDAHSDGVGCGVVTQRHQQIPSTSLEKTIDNNKNNNNNKLFIFNCLIALLSILSLILCFLCLPVFPSSTCQPLHIPYPFSL